jgi:hypothetical protein
MIEARFALPEGCVDIREASNGIPAVRARIRGESRDDVGKRRFTLAKSAMVDRSESRVVTLSSEDMTFQGREYRVFRSRM